VNSELYIGNMWEFDLWFFLLHTCKVSHVCKTSPIDGKYLLDASENSYFRSNLSEDLQQCSGLYRSLAAGVRPPDQQLSSFIEAGICGTGTYSYILLSGDWRSGGNDSVWRLCVCKIPEAKVTDFLDFRTS
jgi:hypothetical protein